MAQVLFARNTGESVAFAAVNAYAAYSTSVLGSVVLIEYSSIVNPHYPGQMAHATAGAVDGATHMGFDAAHGQTDTTLAFAC